MIDRARKLPIALFLSLFLAACAAHPDPGAGPILDVAAEEQTIRELDRQWAGAMAVRDAPRAASFYAEDGLIMPPNGPSAQGRAAVEQFWGGLFQLPNVALTFQPTRIQVSDLGDMAYDIGTYSLAFDGPGGRVQDQGKYLVVWEKVDGEWKVMADMFSSNVPVPAPGGAGVAGGAGAAGPPASR